MSFVQKLEVNYVLNQVWNSLSGYKTHIIAWGSFGVVLLGHFCGPLHIGSVVIPQFSVDDVMNQLKQSGLFSALRAGVASQGGTPS